MKRAVTLRTAVGCALAVLGVPGVHADEPSSVHVTLGLTAQRDSNLLRLADERTPREAGVDGDERGDTVLVPYALLDALLVGSRQGLALHAGIRGLYYDHYGNFDTHVSDWRATWRGAFAGGFDSEVGTGREEQVTRFEDFVGNQRNELTVDSINARATWRPRPDRRVALLFDGYKGTNSQAVRRSGDYEIRNARLEAGAATTQNNEFAVGARFTDGNYPNRAIFAAAPVDNSYKQYQADVSFAYNPGGRTRLDLRGGYAWRRHEQVRERNFNATVGHAIGTWQATGKLVLEGEFGRDVDGVDDYDRIYSVTSSRRAAARFLVSAKVELDATFRQRRTSFRGDPANFLSQLIPTDPREDRARERTLAAVWSISDAWFINTSYQWLDRTSNRPGLQYRARVLQFTTQYRW